MRERREERGRRGRREEGESGGMRRGKVRGHASSGELVCPLILSNHHSEFSKERGD